MRSGHCLVIGVVSVLLATSFRGAWAQNSSLFSGATARTSGGREDIAPPERAAASRSGRRRSPITLKDSSWTYRSMPPPREIQEHDIVSVRVDVLSRMESDGELRRRKNAQYDARLKDWILLDGLRSMRPSPQREGEPRARGELKSDYRSQGELETSESLVFNLACEVVDIRPNGNMVLEGRSSIIINEERWSYILTGICRPEAIGPDNVVLSRDIINLDIRKGETGSVAAGYQRRWFQKLFDMIQPF
ncbi:MAG: flagellar basal body L-ring protein FlgH [Planctomycetota bacterium]